MEKALINKSVVFCFALAIVFTIAEKTVAISFLPNDEGEKIETMVNKLAKKLLLSPDQTSKVTAILTEYFRNAESANGDNTALESVRKTASKKINEILDTKQQMKFEIIETDWWKEANE